MVRFSSRPVVALFRWLVAQLLSAQALRTAAFTDIATLEADLMTTFESREAEVAKNISYLEIAHAEGVRTENVIERAQRAASELAESAAEASIEAERVRKELRMAELTMASPDRLRTQTASETTAADL